MSSHGGGMSRMRRNPVVDSGDLHQSVLIGVGRQHMSAHRGNPLERGLNRIV